MKKYTFSIPATAENGMPTRLYPGGFFPDIATWIKWTNNLNEAVTWDDLHAVNTIAAEFLDTKVITLEDTDDTEHKELDDKESPSDSKRRTTLFD